MFHKWTVSSAVVRNFPRFLLTSSAFRKNYQKKMLNKRKHYKKRYSLKSQTAN